MTSGDATARATRLARLRLAVALVVLKQRPPELSTAAFIRALSGKQQREHRVLSNSVQQPQTGDPSHVDDLDAALVLYRNDTTTHTSGTARLATAALRWRQRAIDAEHRWRTATDALARLQQVTPVDSDHAPAYANTTRVLLDRHAFQAQIRAALRWSSHCSDKSTSAASLGDVLAMLSGVEMVLRANAEDTATDTQGSHRAAIAADLANGIIATAATMVVELSTYSSDSQACRHKSSIIDTFGGVVVRLFQLVCDSNDSNVVSETRRAVTAAFQRALPEVVGALVKLTERFLDALLREDDLSPTHSHSHTMDGDDHRRLVRCLLAIAAHELELGRSIAVAAITHIIKEIHAFPDTVDARNLWLDTRAPLFEIVEGCMLRDNHTAEDAVASVDKDAILRHAMDLLRNALTTGTLPFAYHRLVSVRVCTWFALFETSSVVKAVV